NLGERGLFQQGRGLDLGVEGRAAAVAEVEAVGEGLLDVVQGEDEAGGIVGGGRDEQRAAFAVGELYLDAALRGQHALGAGSEGGTGAGGDEQVARLGHDDGVGGQGHVAQRGAGEQHGGERPLREDEAAEHGGEQRGEAGAAEGGLERDHAADRQAGDVSGDLRHEIGDERGRAGAAGVGPGTGRELHGGDDAAAELGPVALQGEGGVGRVPAAADGQPEAAPGDDAEHDGVDDEQRGAHGAGEVHHAGEAELHDEERGGGGGEGGEAEEELRAEVFARDGGERAAQRGREV